MDKKTKDILSDKMEIIRIDVPYFYRICYNKDASIKEKFIGFFNEETIYRVKNSNGGDNNA